MFGTPLTARHAVYCSARCSLFGMPFIVRRAAHCSARRSFNIAFTGALIMPSVLSPPFMARSADQIFRARSADHPPRARGAKDRQDVAPSVSAAQHFSVFGHHPVATPGASLMPQLREPSLRLQAGKHSSVTSLGTQHGQQSLRTQPGPRPRDAFGSRPRNALGMRPRHTLGVRSDRGLGMRSGCDHGPLAVTRGGAAWL